MKSTASTTTLYPLSLTPLSKDDECHLALRAQQGDKQARETLIRANLRFVISYVSRFCGHGLTQEELEMEGIIGLIKALDRFDPQKGIRLITYARLWILNEVETALNTCGYTNRLSDARLRKRSQIVKALKQTENMEDGNERIAFISECTEIPQKEVEAILYDSQTAISLNALIEGDDGKEHAASFADTRAPSPADEAIAACMTETLTQALNTLPQTERFVLTNYYGLNDTKESMTFSQIAAQFGNSRQWAFLVEKKAQAHLAEKLCA